MDTTNTTAASLMRPPIIVRHTDTLKSVVERMVGEKRNSLIVVDGDGRFVGSVNALDVIREVLPDYLEEDAIAARFADDSLLKKDVESARDTLVKEFMSKDMPTIHTDSHIVEAAVLASKHGRGRIAVLDENKKPVGVLTRTEIKQVIASYL